MSFITAIINFFKKLFGIKTTIAVVPPIPEYSGWSITQGSLKGPLPQNSFDFPLALNASTAWISYIEKPYTPITGKSSISLTYTISGTDPVFNCDSPDNQVGAIATLRLLLHQTEDNLSGIGPYAYFRQFSVAFLPLTVGTNTISVPLTYDQWIPAYPLPPNTEEGFNSCLANLGSVGFVLGGGYYAGHGVCVTSGSATLTIDSLSIT